MVDLSNVALSDLAAATGNVDFGGHKGVNVADPGTNQDAATKKYHDDHRYTDAEVNALIAVHTAIVSAHHTDHKIAKSETAEFNTLNAGENVWIKHTGTVVKELISAVNINDACYIEGRSYSTTTYNSPTINFKKSHSNTETLVTTVNGDRMGGFSFYGVNGANETALGGLFVLEQDGAAGGTRIPTKIRFMVYDNTSTLHFALTILKNGWVGFGTDVPTSPVDYVADRVRVRNSKTPASAGATGIAGEICWDANYVYVCVATNTWKRSGLATW